MHPDSGLISSNLGRSKKKMLSSKAYDRSPEMLHKLCMYRKSKCVSCVQAASAIGTVDTSNVGGGVKYGMGLLRMLWRD